MKPRLAISANAIPSVGGQGLNLLHMLEAYGGDFDLFVFANSFSTGFRGATIEGSKLSAMIGKVPFARRLKDWRSYLNDTHFDRVVAKKLKAAEVFQGAVGQCRDSFRRAKELKCATVLDVVTLHIDDFFREQAEECARFKLRGIIHPRLKERILEEYRNADLIRVMSNVAQNTFLKRGFAPEKIVVAHPPVTIENFPRATFDDSVFRVVFVGLIEPWKGFHYLVDAFNRLHEKNRELVFWGGTGSRAVSEYFKQQMRDHPEIKLRPAAVRQAGFAEVYGKANVLVHPSLCDGFGLVVGEALACGVPAIVSANAGAADLIVEGVNGYIVPPRDSGAIVERLNFLSQNPARLKTMGQAAWESARSLTLENFRQELVPRVKQLIVERSDKHL